MTSRFDNAKIVGSQVEVEEYRHQVVNRGHPDYVMGRSSLMEFAICPSRWVRGYEGKDTDATDYGRLIDCLVLSPDAFADNFIVSPEEYPGAKGEMKPWTRQANYCKEWELERTKAGLEVIKKPEMDAASAAKARLLYDEQIAELIEHSEHQVMVTADYKDKETNVTVPVKALIDILPDVRRLPWSKSLADFKTARNAHPARWGRVVFDDDLDAQAALYLDMYVAATDEDRTDFLHIVQESFPPFEIGKRIISAEFLEIGRHKYLSALRYYARCLAEKHWPTYDENARLGFNGFQVIGPDAWMVARLADTTWNSTTQKPQEKPESEYVDLIP